MNQDEPLWFTVLAWLGALTVLIVGIIIAPVVYIIMSMNKLELRTRLLWDRDRIERIVARYGTWNYGYGKEEGEEKGDYEPHSFEHFLHRVSVTLTENPRK